MNIVKKITRLCWGIGLCVTAVTAQAVTPANTLLTHTAKLTYAGNATGITTQVTVAISLVPAEVSASTTPPDLSLAEGQAYSGTYVVMSNANGPDAYTITTSDESVGAVTGTSAPSVTVTNVILGATAAIEAVTGALAGKNTITVPADGAVDSAVNGISAEDTVVINGTTYEVTSVVDNAAGTSTITLATDLIATMAIGDGIYESITFNSTISNIGSTATGVNDVIVRVGVASDTNAALVFSDDATVSVVSVSFVKYVRNVDSPAVGVTPITYNGDDYYRSGINAAPNQLLEYLLVLETGAAGLTSAVASDTLSEFTTYQLGTTQLNLEAVADGNGTSADPTFPLNTADTTDGGLLLDDVTGRPANTQGTGVVGANVKVHVLYRVKVDP